MSTPSIKVGQGNWGIKAGNLLGYANTEKKYVARDFTVGRLLDTATRVNASGNIEGVNANVPRIDYFGGQASLLVEPAATNDFIESQTLFTTHLAQNLTTTGYTNAATSPDGSVTAEKFVPNTTNGVHGIANGSSLAITSGTTYTFSLFVKSDGGPYNLIALQFDSTTAWGATRSCIFNASNGTNFAVPSGATMTSENYGNGWYRIRATLTAVGSPAAGLYQYRIYVANASGNLAWAAPSGNTNGIFCWGAQLETGSVATSYIPTTTGSVTRNADAISLTGVAGLIGQTEGTLYVEVDLRNLNTGVFRRLLAISDGTTSNVFQIFTSDSSSIVNLGSSASGFTTLSSPTAIVGVAKIAFAYALNDVAFYINGNLIGTRTPSTIPACNTISLGSRVDSSNFLNDRIRAVALYTTRLTNDELAAITSP